MKSPYRGKQKIGWGGQRESLYTERGERKAEGRGSKMFGLYGEEPLGERKHPTPE